MKVSSEKENITKDDTLKDSGFLEALQERVKKCFFARVDDRSQSTLLQIIKDNIKPGTTIISDYWKAYQCLDQEGFEHLKVNHSLNFVDPDSGAHTNTIGSTWRALKKSLPKYGTVKSLHDTYFSQYCVKKKYIHGSEDPFLEFLKLIKRIYNPETRKQKLISKEISIEIHNSKIKKPRILQDITNTNTNSPSIILHSSLVDFM